MLGLLTQAVTETGTGTMSSAVVASLQAIASSSGAAYLNMPAPLAGLAQNLIDGGQYQVTTALSANTTTAAQLQNLINQWFLGEDLPTIDTNSGSTSGYVLAAGTLYGSSGVPQYTDIVQGNEGDCWLMASCAEIALKQPSIIEGSFTDDGLQNGVDRDGAEAGPDRLPGVEAWHDVRASESAGVRGPDEGEAGEGVAAEGTPVGAGDR